MSSSSSAGDKYGPDIHDGDRAAWANMNDKARTWLLQMTVFIISIKKNLDEIELWNSYFIRVLKYWGLKIRVLANPCVPYQKTVQDTGATYCADATLKGLCKDEEAWKSCQRVHKFLEFWGVI